MGILTRAGDLVYTFRFLKLLVTSFEDTDAYKLGIIDKDGKRIKSKEVKTDDEKSSYTPFHRLVFNIKRLIPGGKIGTYASALYLIKENYIQKDGKLEEIMVENTGVNPEVFLSESSSWFIVKENQLAPGNYRLRENKILNNNYEELAKAKDRVIVGEGCTPVGSIFGLDVYEVTHYNSKQKVYITVGELYK